MRVKVSAVPAANRPRSQVDRRARTREALLAAAARGLSQYGYANLVLERVASDAGYTRGALYHLFAGKQDLALAVVGWVEETWWAHMGELIADDRDPAGVLVGVARAHALYCRGDVARVAMTLRVEFNGQDHPVGRAVEQAVQRVIVVCTGLIEAGRSNGTIPAGAPAGVLASALVGAVEGLVISLAGHAPFDELLAEKVAAGLLGLALFEEDALPLHADGRRDE